MAARSPRLRPGHPHRVATQQRAMADADVRSVRLDEGQTVILMPYGITIISEGEYFTGQTFLSPAGAKRLAVAVSGHRFGLGLGKWAVREEPTVARDG